jgi:hypothetical protein
MNSNTELINVILEVIMQNPTKDINEERPSRTNDPNNLWNIICSKLYDTTCYSDANRIFKLWHSNVSKLAEQVTSLCGSIYRNNGKKSFISLPVTAEEWTILTTYIVNSPRARFTSQFSDFLSEKLQECNIKCWICSEHNYFKKNNSQKTNSPFWRGSYKCIDPLCSKKFTAVIHKIIKHNKSSHVIIFVTENNENNIHESKVLKKIRCIGSQRLEQERDLAINSSLNCQSHNILHNKIHIKRNSN